MPRQLKVFLCHAHSDKDTVKALYVRLKREDVDVWLDKEKLLPGVDWEYEIRKAVRESDVVIVCLSKQFNQAGFRQREVRIALEEADKKPEGEIFIIPARLEECDNLESLSRWHWVDLFESDGFQRLIRTLRIRADKIGAALRQRRATSPNQKENTEQQKVVHIELARQGLEEQADHETSEKAEGERLARDEKKHLFGQNEELVASKPVVKNERWHRVGIVGVILIFLLLASFGGYYFIKNLPPSIGSTQISDIDGMAMVFVPAGEFTMGSDAGGTDEQPGHTVYIDAFWIDRTEVTNAMYAKCEADGECEPPLSSNSYIRASYYGNPTYDNFPVIYINWNQANAYCKWAGRELPTEAQWEKAARWIDGRTYPWGEEIGCDFASYGRCVGDTTEVGLYPDGMSIYGALDMTGNVWEWVSSLYQPYPYDANDGRENLITSGPRVLRGGAWYSSADSARSANRDKHNPTDTDNLIGFRCSLSPYSK